MQLCNCNSAHFKAIATNRLNDDYVSKPIYIVHSINLTDNTCTVKPVNVDTL